MVGAHGAEKYSSHSLQEMKKEETAISSRVHLLNLLTTSQSGPRLGIKFPIPRLLEDIPNPNCSIRVPLMIPVLFGVYWSLKYTADAICVQDLPLSSTTLRLKKKQTN